MQQRNRGRYLDVSEYMLKEYSPMNRAMSADFRHGQRAYASCVLLLTLLIQNHHHDRYPTPEIAPIDHDTSTLKITPFLNGLLALEHENLDQFLLDSSDRAVLEGRPRERTRSEPTRTRRRSNSLVIFHIDNQLEGIIEESDYEFNSYEESYSEGLLGEDLEEDEISVPCSQKPSQLDQRQLQIEAQFEEKLQRYSREPKGSLLREIRRVVQTRDELNQNQKLENIKKVIQSYIVDFQVPCFQEAWHELELPLKQKVEVLIQGIEFSFRKRIGSLSFEQRRLKLLKYLQKKRLRKWRKKVSYDCRKKVADSRLRIKGKFVTRQQVCEQLGIQDYSNYTGQEIKELLQRKIDEAKEKSTE